MQHINAIAMCDHWYKIGCTQKVVLQIVVNSKYRIQNVAVLPARNEKINTRSICHDSGVQSSLKDFVVSYWFEGRKERKRV